MAIYVKENIPLKSVLRFKAKTMIIKGEVCRHKATTKFSAFCHFVSPQPIF